MKINLLFLILISNFSFAQGTWTWMGGPDTIGAVGRYGDAGVPLLNNHPPASAFDACWTDLTGSFWMYEGDNLWTFNPSTTMWTWIEGHGNGGFYSCVYGTKGVAGGSPSTRTVTPTTWVDSTGDLWLYGGALLSDLYGDMWRYHIATGEWTWMAGYPGAPTFAVYGTQGVADSANTPGGRGAIGRGWKDKKGRFWLYGGATTFQTYDADMWMYDPRTNWWTWESGYKSEHEPLYGKKGAFSDTITPGGRSNYSSWTDDDGNFWLFGGSNYNSNFGSEDVYCDMWKYNPLINQWAWMGGSSIAGAEGFFGNPCQSDTSFYPDARFQGIAWKEKSGNLMLFGGGYLDVNFFSYGDVCVFLPRENQWARLTYSNALDDNAFYGRVEKPSPSNYAGARSGSGSWVDKNGNAWLFGGEVSGSGYYLADMWRYESDVSCLTGTIDPTVGKQWNVFPNPADELMTIDYNANGLGSIIKIYNNVGQLLYSDEINAKQNIFTRDFPDGLYLIVLQTGGRVETKKIIITH